MFGKISLIGGMEEGRKSEVKIFKFLFVEMLLIHFEPDGAISIFENYNYDGRDSFG